MQRFEVTATPPGVEPIPSGSVPVLPVRSPELAAAIAISAKSGSPSVGARRAPLAADVAAQALRWGEHNSWAQARVAEASAEEERRAAVARREREDRERLEEHARLERDRRQREERAEQNRIAALAAEAEAEARKREAEAAQREREKDWKCACTLLNRWDAPVCLACLLPRPCEGGCKVCTFINEKGTAACAMCGAAL